MRSISELFKMFREQMESRLNSMREDERGAEEQKQENVRHAVAQQAENVRQEKYRNLVLVSILASVGIGILTFIVEIAHILSIAPH